ncbi:MAG: hypothetical protein H6739_36280 [Alphaproteobacteria bacterium]|nr:hypothetical protein [Alphaproteobacteria bacterium]
MWIRGVSVEGFAALPRFEATELERVVRVGGDPAACGALYQALLLGLSAFSAVDLRGAFARLGFGADVQVEGDGLPDAVILGVPERARAWLAPSGDRSLKVSLEIALDPPQFGVVQQHALREPGLATALGEDAASLLLTAGFAFTRDLSVISCALFSIRLGDVEPRPGEKSPWKDALLTGLAGRVCARDPLELDPLAFAAAERSPDPDARAAVAKARAALSGAPFSLGAPQVVDPGDGAVWLAIGDDLQPLTALGPEAVDAAGLCQSVFCDPGEILLIRNPGALAADPEAVRAWLAGQVETAGGPLEQVWMFGAPNVTLEVTKPPAPAAAGRVSFR